MTKNLLGSETSPYLLQHKDNPVHWRPWGTGALDEARAQGKPILLSIGYAACHWCHVMAHESFEDEDVAALMNELYVNVKVDREERPDIDAIYMSALHHLGEQGGWPLTMFLTPAGEPIWGGTYFPKEPRYGRPGFMQVLREVARIFRDEPVRVEHNREALLSRLQDQARAEPGERLSPGLLDQAARQLLTVCDPEQGGTQGAPKFPQTSFLEMLWRAGQRSGDERFAAIVELSLMRMCQGGIYDHAGGGFARYAVDDQWLVPHFEKMLYDNALLLDLMCLVYRQTQSPLLRQRIEETIGWLLRDMRDPHGGFYSSLDADSDGEEGKFYVWRADEVRNLLGPDADAFMAHYDVSEEGNWEGKSILTRRHTPDWLGEEVEQRFAAQRESLRVARETRIRPGLDDKILADWNGLLIEALVHAAFVFGRPDWHQAARAAFSFVSDVMSAGARLKHSARQGRAAQKGLLSDYANMIAAALSLYEQDGAPGDLARAVAWFDILDTHFIAPDGSYYMSADDADDLIVRPRSGLDDATPNGNAVAAQAAMRLWHLTGEARYRARADAIFSSFAGAAARQLFGFASLFNAYDFALRPVELVIVADKHDAQVDTLLAAARGAATPNLLLTLLTADRALPDTHPAAGKTAIAGQATAYVCTAAGCSLPVHEPDALQHLLAEAG